MAGSFKRLFEPGQIGTLTVPNRLVMTAVFDNFASETGTVTQRQIDYYAERAKGGTGLVTVAYANVDYPGGWVAHNQVRIDEDSRITGHHELVDTIHDYGMKVGIQLGHPGKERFPDPAGIIPGAVAPSPIPGDIFPLGTPRELSTDEVAALVRKFGAAAGRAKAAGYDIVEIHGAHGYLIAEFMSARSNKRNDRYGGDLKGRMTFPLDVLAAVRAAVGPGYPVVYRICADEFVPGGLTLDETRVIARMLEEAGVDALNVSGGCYGSMAVVFDTMEKEEGWRSYLAAEIKKVVKVPVCTVGNIRSPEVAEGILAEGKADFIGFGRTLVADPHWGRKVKENRIDDIIRCVSCNQGCLGRIFQGLYLTCSINPVTGREGRWAKMEPAAKAKKVAVVGAGPAGMEAARVAALRGHKVTLYERERKPGGQAKLVAAGPGKANWGSLTEYQSRQIAKAKVALKRGREGTAKSILATAPDVCIIATGAVPRVPDLPGAGGANVVTAWDVLSGKVKLKGEKVIVAGGGTVGCETAEFLAGSNEVTIVEMLPAVASDMEMVHMVAFMMRLAGLKIRVITEAVIQSFNSKGLVYKDKEGRDQSLEGSKVVLAMGSVPSRALAEALKGKVSELYCIGDANQPAKITEAIYEGSRVGRLI
ncbi:MAG: FAD-dependent oxidoreductase [Deltaproteobacteria bacterium]|nr:FAD-dependent oxidoreductase [Deltaproteobacteria bacterium]